MRVRDGAWKRASYVCCFKLRTQIWYWILLVISSKWKFIFCLLSSFCPFIPTACCTCCLDIEHGQNMHLQETILCSSGASSSQGNGAVTLHDFQTGSLLVSFKQTNAGRHSTVALPTKNEQGGFILATQPDKSIINAYYFQKVRKICKTKFLCNVHSAYRIKSRWKWSYRKSWPVLLLTREATSAQVEHPKDASTSGRLVSYHRLLWISPETDSSRSPLEFYLMSGTRTTAKLPSYVSRKMAPPSFPVVRTRV